jgi:hypothetical protein
MKKTNLIFFLLVVSCFVSLPATAQDLSFDIKADTVKNNGSATGAIHITVTDGYGPYIYMLFNKEPWDGGTELARSPQTSATSWVFNGLGAGTYLVCVQDAGKNSVLEFALVPAKSISYLSVPGKNQKINLLAFTYPDR